MLQIKINNIGLDLFADTALQFELNNPAYFGSDSDLLAASLVFSFDLPLSANNRVLLRQPQMIGSTEPFLENENCTIEYDFLLLFVGKITLTAAQKTACTVSIVIDALVEMKEKTLQEIALPTTYSLLQGSTTPNEFAKKTIQEYQNPKKYPIVFFPIYNTLNAPENTPNSDIYISLKEWQNYYDTDFGNFIEKNTIDTERSLNFGSVTPFLKLYHVLEAIFATFGLRLDNNFQTDTELLNLVLYSFFNIIHPTTAEWKTTIDLRSLLNDQTCAEFLKQLIRTFCLGLFPNPQNGSVEILPLKNILNAPTAHDWTHKELIGYQKTKPNTAPTSLGYKTDIASFQREALFIYKGIFLLNISNYEKFKTGKQGGAAFEADIFTTKDGFSPTIRQRQDDLIQSPIAAIKPPEADNRLPQFLYFFRGIFQRKDKDGIVSNFPLGSSHHFYNAFPTAPTSRKIGNYSLDFVGENGIFDTFWKDWLTFLENKKEIKTTFLLSITDIKNFNFKLQLLIFNLTL